ncbi:hypothetical protein D3C72_716940 [compost metagenome]
MFDQADDVAYPQTAAISGDNAVIDDVIATLAKRFFAVILRTGQVGRVNNVVPEPGNQPVRLWIAKQVFGVGRHIAVGEVAHPRFPGDGRQALDQATIVVFAAAQFLFEVDTSGDFRTQAAVDADHHGENRHQQQQTW